jgi:hypothetical protein
MTDWGKVYSALLYAGFSIAGAAIAYLYFHGMVWIAVLIVALAIAVGHFVGNVAAQRLLPEHPRAAMWCLELWVLAPGSFAALAAAAVIVVSVALNAPDHASADQTKTLDAVSGALAALITTIFLKVFEDADDDVVGARVEAVFQAHFKRYEPGASAHSRVARFPEGSDAERLVYSKSGAITGWGLRDRHKRARKLKPLLATRKD